jgi:hypothetical protein
VLICIILIIQGNLKYCVNKVTKSLSPAYKCPHCWGIGLPYGLHIRRTGHNPPHELSAGRYKINNFDN